MKPKVVGVWPAEVRARRNELFDALEQAFAVRFEGRDIAARRELDGVLSFGGAESDAEPSSPAAPMLQLIADEQLDGRPHAPVRLTDASTLPSMLAGQELAEASMSEPIALPDARATVLAERAGAPVWSTVPGAAGATHVAALAPLELGPQETLADRLTPGRFFALLPLIRYLQELTIDQAYAPPPLSACFVLDDPNLHAPSYGYVDFRELARDAEQRHYHVSMAMIPIDGWFAHRPTARVFREFAHALSISIHGNDHIGGELERRCSQVQTRALLAQALRRVTRFERRYGVGVCRVMAPPHGLCSEQTAREMVPLGFEALSVSRPYPWFARRPMRWSARPDGESPLAGWLPATPVAGGTPVLLRVGLSTPSDDLAFRAFLGQPLIIAGHHDDLAEGSGVLAQIATQVNALGDVRWASLSAIARSRFCTRRAGRTLHIRMYTRKVELDIPAGIEEIVVEAPLPLSGDASDSVVCGGSFAALQRDSWVAISEPVGTEGAARIEVALARSGTVDPVTVPAPTWRPQPFVRRLATEGRDRLAPLARRHG